MIGFGAHPDDVEIFFFGTLAAAQALQGEIGWVIASDGARGGDAGPAELRATRRREAEAAGRLLGVTPVFLDRPDGGLEDDPGLARLVEHAIADLSPDLVLTHAPNDYHPDHRALSRAVRRAAAYEVPVVYCDTLLGVGFEPAIYVDVAAHMDLKLQAIDKHRSQDAARFADACRTWNRFRALQCGAWNGFAEAFRPEASFPHADLRQLLPPPPAGDRRR